MPNLPRPTVHVLSAFVLLLSAVALGADAPADRSTPEIPASAGGPAATQPVDHATLDALAASSWERLGLKNILGAGTDEVLRFHSTGGRLTVDQTFRRFRSVNDRKGPASEDTTTSPPAAVEGPLLRLGDVKQTFFLVPGKRLVLSALVPKGNGSWYFAAGLSAGGGADAPKAPGGGREMWIDFADDPLSKEQGKATIRVRTEGHDARQEAAHFTVTRADASGRMVDVVLDDPQHARWARILFPPEGTYGLSLDQPNQSSRVFVAAKTGN